MASDAPRNKRPRNDENDGPGQHSVPPKRDADVWLADGHIVIVAQGFAFRVLKSILAQRSEVFRDLFTLPVPETADSLDGCPLVHVSDSPYDLRHLLLVLCCGKK